MLDEVTRKESLATDTISIEDKLLTGIDFEFKGNEKYKVDSRLIEEAKRMISEIQKKKELISEGKEYCSIEQPKPAILF